MKQVRTYEAKTLFSGAVIQKEGQYVAIPNKLKPYRILVSYRGQEMVIENWLNADGYRKFPDKYGRKDEKGNTIQYTLGYFKWNPTIKEPEANPEEYNNSRLRLKEEWEKINGR